MTRPTAKNWSNFWKYCEGFSDYSSEGFSEGRSYDISSKIDLVVADERSPSLPLTGVQTLLSPGTQLAGLQSDNNIKNIL